MADAETQVAPVVDVPLEGKPKKEHWKVRAKRLREEAAARGEDGEAVAAVVEKAAEETPASGPYMDPADFYGPVLAALLASGRSEAHHLVAFGKQAWVDYKALVDWARTDGA